MSTNDANAHIEDGQLLRLLGGELSAGERDSASAHLDRCEDCAGRLDAVRQQNEAVAGLLAGLDVAPVSAARRARSLAAVRQAAVRTAAAQRPAARRRFAFHGTLARAAAIVGLLAAGGVAASPAGAWLVDRVRDLIAPTPAEVAEVAEPEATPMAAHSSVVAFTPAGNALTIELASAQESGTLTLWVADTPSASVRVSGGEGDLDVIVLPASLRIENHADAVADYEIVIPARLARVRVRIAGAEEMVLRPGELGAGWSAVIGLRHGAVDESGTGL